MTAIEWFAEKYNYITWMRNRDEISAGLADEWRKHYLEQALEMEKQQIIDAATWGALQETGEKYYSETYKKDNQ